MTNWMLGEENLNKIADVAVQVGAFIDSNRIYHFHTTKEGEDRLGVVGYFCSRMCALMDPKCCPHCIRVDAADWLGGVHEWPC